jgi:hypothetical protein
MAKPARPEQTKSARSSRQLSRFCYLINPDKDFSTHTVMAALQAAKVKPQYWADQEYRDVNESLPIGRAGPGLPGDVLVRGSAEGQNEDNSGTRNSHNMRIRRRGRIAARGQKIQSDADLHEIRRPKLGTYQGLLLRLQRI